jgi:hypothetical protein
MAIDPIRSGFSEQPPKYPLGVSISDKITLEKVKRHVADGVYENHHSYIPRGRLGWHYGVLLDEQLVGAITFSTWPAKANLRGVDSDDIVEVSRVCIAHDTPNLASCAMAKAQDKFVSEEVSDYGVGLFVTYIHNKYEGSMFKALRGKGWEFDELRESNGLGGGTYAKEENEIYDTDKERWICKL